MGPPPSTPPVHPVPYVLVGDGESPHLLKWAFTLSEVTGNSVELYALSSRNFLPAFDTCIPPERRLALNTRPKAAGGNVALLGALPRAARWLKACQPQVLHAHYLTSHGTLAWLAQRLWGVPGLLVSSAWGSDILLTPQRSALARQLTRAVLKASAVCTADSHHMAQAMRELGASQVDVFPFGLQALPPEPGPKEPDLFFSNRLLEPLYRIDRVLELFAAVAAQRPAARLIVAHHGSMRAALEQRAHALHIADRVDFVGLLTPARQAQVYARAQWHLSLPESDSVSVSVLEAMAHGCIPVLSDLPANRELVRHGDNGWIVDPTAGGVTRFVQTLPDLLARATDIAQSNRQWVADHALFPPQVRRFLQALPLPHRHAP